MSGIDPILYGPHLSRLVCFQLNIHFYLDIVPYITECKWSGSSFCHCTDQLLSPWCGRVRCARLFCGQWL